MIGPNHVVSYMIVRFPWSGSGVGRSTDMCMQLRGKSRWCYLTHALCEEGKLQSILGPVKARIEKPYLWGFFYLVKGFWGSVRPCFIPFRNINILYGIFLCKPIRWKGHHKFFSYVCPRGQNKAELMVCGSFSTEPESNALFYVREHTVGHVSTILSLPYGKGFGRVLGNNQYSVSLDIC